MIQCQTMETNERAQRRSEMMKNDGNFDEIIFPSAVIKYFLSASEIIFHWFTAENSPVSDIFINCFCFSMVFGSFFVRRDGKQVDGAFSAFSSRYIYAIIFVGRKWIEMIFRALENYYIEFLICLFSLNPRLNLSTESFDSLICFHTQFNFPYHLILFHQILDSLIKLSSSSSLLPT